MNPVERLSIKIRLYRTSLNITQQEMATKLGLSLRTFQRIETCQSPIDMTIIYKICECYDIPFFDLVNPDIKREELADGNFFSSVEDFEKEDFFSDKPDFIALKDKVIDLVKKDPAKITMVSDLPEFENSPYYLYVCNLHFAVGNAKTRAITGLPDDKYRTLKTFKDASIMIKSWDICLKYKDPAFKLLSEHETDKAQLKIMGYSYFDFNEESMSEGRGLGKHEPLLFGAFQLL